jgi:hypothetical protein
VTLINSPVTKDERSEARNEAGPAMSSGVPTLPKGTVLPSCAKNASSFKREPKNAVRIGPGIIALTYIVNYPVPRAQGVFNNFIVRRV